MKKDIQLWYVITSALVTSIISDEYLRLTMPEVGYCGENTILKCHYTGNYKMWAWEKNDTQIVRRGTATQYAVNNKYEEIIGNQTIDLIVKNIEIFDEDVYRCSVDLSLSKLMPLQIECITQKTVHVTATKAKAVRIAFDWWHPNTTQNFSITLSEVGSVIQTNGSFTCNSVLLVNDYKKCIWTSNKSLHDGMYICRILVTTFNRTANITKTITIKASNVTLIVNGTSDFKSHSLLSIESQLLVIACVSNGGYPAPTVIIYREVNASLIILNATTTEHLENDDYFTVTAHFMFIPERTDDSSMLICRSYYPEAPENVQSSTNDSYRLLLLLKPDQPLVSPSVLNVNPGEQVNISCVVRNCRPAANITWEYHGEILHGEVIPTYIASSATHSVRSVLTISVTNEDKFVHCVVTHAALKFPMRANATIYMPEKEAKLKNVVWRVFGAFCVVLIVGSFFGVAFYRKRKPKRECYQEPTEESADKNNVNYANVNMQEMSTKSANDCDQYYNNTANIDAATLPITAIRVQDLFDFVFNKSDTADRLKQEFESLPKGLQTVHTAASKQENKFKNKYKNIYPYDGTRVILCRSSVNQSDYINACYIHGFHEARAYVATQGVFANILMHAIRGKATLEQFLSEEHVQYRCKLCNYMC